MKELSRGAAVRMYRDALRAERRNDLRASAEIEVLGTLIDLAEALGREFGLRRAIAWADRIVECGEPRPTRRLSCTTLPRTHGRVCDICCDAKTIG